MVTGKVYNDGERATTLSGARQGHFRNIISWQICHDMMYDMIYDIYDTRNWDTFYVLVSRARGDFEAVLSN